MSNKNDSGSNKETDTGQSNSEEMSTEDHTPETEMITLDELPENIGNENIFLLENLVTQGINVLASPAKCGKSTLAFQMGVAVVTNQSLFVENKQGKKQKIFKCNNSGNVLLISYEEGRAKLNKRKKSFNPC